MTILSNRDKSCSFIGIQPSGQLYHDTEILPTYFPDSFQLTLNPDYAPMHAGKLLHHDSIPAPFMFVPRLRQIQFDVDHNYKYFENDVLFVNSKFSLKKGVSITGNDSALIINNIPGSPKSIVFKDLDSLTLFDEWRSAFEHHYSRLK